MKLIILILILFIFIIFSFFKKKEYFKIQELHPLYIKDYDYSINNKQLPWCEKWSYKKHKLKCYINKHLQRKCMWVC